MTKVLGFLKSNKYIVIWTVAYIAIMWCILKWLFNFDMFVLHNWILLLHAHLRGFPGFVFGILVLSAVPVYIATSIIILRTKKPLFTIPVPKFMEPVPEPKAESSAEEQSNKTDEQAPAAEEAQPVQQKIIPTELRAAFVRARSHMGPTPKSNFDISNITKSMHPASEAEPVPELQQSGDLPLPNDFDVAPAEDDDQIFSETPTFKPLFSDLDFDVEEDVPVSESESADNADDASTNSDLQPVIDYLTKNGEEFFVNDGLIITKQDIIAAHSDPDFWIADEDTWFASGKQKPSPINELILKSHETGLRPVLYLGSTNILDFGSRITEWEKSGIEVITDLSGLKQA